MHGTHPLQRFLDRHGLSQSELARTVRVSRETVNRWVRGRNLPVGENLIRAIDFARRFEPRLEARELFPPIARPRGLSEESSGLTERWGEACVICRVAWNADTEHLPLALLHPEIGNHPAGGLCETCARRAGVDPTDESPEPDRERDPR
ncbi:MAG: helix-turn-helix domain-containing protein [bacterium]|nr:helix-turn-helix domain-containing protein [bacterium]